MTKNISNTIKAGRLISLLGWVAIFITLPILTLISEVQRNSTAKVIPEAWLIAAFVVAVLYALSALVVGKNIQQGKRGVYKFGWLICLLSPISFIFGILIGLVAIFLLVRARNEPDARS